MNNILLAIDHDLVYLQHTGQTGMKWHTHKFGKWQSHAVYAQGMPDPNAQTNRVDPKKNSVYNLERWGSDKDHNILFITGFSGSGKSTLANSLKSKDTNVINLDLFMEQVHKDSLKERDQEFVKYLSKTNSDFYKISNPEKYGISRRTKQFGNLLGNFQNSITNFSKQQYDKGKKVVVEGVSLHDDTLFPDKNYFKDKPLAIPKTDRFTSFIRSGVRDDKLHLQDLTPSDIKEYVQWYNQAARNLNNIKKIMT